MSAGKRLEEARRSAGLSKQALGKRIGVSHTAVGNWENGDVINIKGNYLLAIEEITGYSFRWILSGRGQKLAKITNAAQRIHDIFITLDGPQRAALENIAENLANIQRTSK